MQIINKFLKEFIKFDYRYIEAISYTFFMFSVFSAGLNEPVKTYLIIIFLFYSGVFFTITGILILHQKKYIFRGFERKKMWPLIGWGYIILSIGIIIILLGKIMAVPE